MNININNVTVNFKVDIAVTLGPWFRGRIESTFKVFYSLVCINLLPGNEFYLLIRNFLPPLYRTVVIMICTGTRPRMIKQPYLNIKLIKWHICHLIIIHLCLINVCSGVIIIIEIWKIDCFRDVNDYLEICCIFSHKNQSLFLFMLFTTSSLICKCSQSPINSSFLHSACCSYCNTAL